MKQCKMLLMVGMLALLIVGCKKNLVSETVNTPAITKNITIAEPASTAAIDTETMQSPDLETPETETPLIITDQGVMEGMSKDILNNMTLEEKIGQLFIVNFENLDKSKGSYYEFRKITNKMEKNMQKYHIGGVIFFSRNIENIEQTKTFIEELQENSRIPLFISVDEEGGEVARIANNSNMNTTKFPTMEEIGASEETEYAYEMGVTIGKK